MDALHGLLYPPQVALIGCGAPRKRPVAVGEAIGLRLTVTVTATATLAADQRVSDGRRGARFIAEIARLLENPEAP